MARHSQPHDVASLADDDSSDELQFSSQAVATPGLGASIDVYKRVSSTASCYHNTAGSHVGFI